MKKLPLIVLLAVVTWAWAAGTLVMAQDVPNTRLLLVRHGEAYANLPNPPDMAKEKLDSLTAKGIAEVTATGVVLKRYPIPIVAVVASPTGRTRETAAIIAREVGLEGVLSEDSAFASVKMGTFPDGRSSTCVTWGRW